MFAFHRQVDADMQKAGQPGPAWPAMVADQVAVSLDEEQVRVAMSFQVPNMPPTSVAVARDLAVQLA